MSLIELLTQQLNVTSEQAEGGAGMLFGLAKEKLSAGDFSQLSNLIPDDLEALIGKAPGAAAADASGGVMGMIGAAAEAFGLGDAAGKLGDLASLAKGFESLGLETEMIVQFANAILDFLKSHGGEGIAALLQSILK